MVQIDEEVLDLDYAICKLDKAYILKLILEEIPTSKKVRILFWQSLSLRNQLISQRQTQ